jgi:hypothetical protein
MRFVWSLFPLFLLGCSTKIDKGFDQMVSNSIHDPTFIPVLFFSILMFLTFIFVFVARAGFYHGILHAMRFTGMTLVVSFPLYYAAGGKWDTSIAMGVAGIMGLMLPILFVTSQKPQSDKEEDDGEDDD